MGRAYLVNKNLTNFFFENPFGLVLFRIDDRLFFPCGGLAMLIFFFLDFS